MYPILFSIRLSSRLFLWTDDCDRHSGRLFHWLKRKSKRKGMIPGGWNGWSLRYWLAVRSAPKSFTGLPVFPIWLQTQRFLPIWVPAGSFTAALSAVLISGWYYCKLHAMNFWEWFDLIHSGSRFSSGLWPYWLSACRLLLWH